VLSCPSSTGQAGDDAGFNIIHFGPASGTARPEYRFTVARYSRPRNGDAFGPLDSNLSDGLIRLPAGRDFSRDPAFQSAIELASCASLKRDQVAALARRLFTRRGFYDEAEPDWASALYTYLVSLHVWMDIEDKFARSGRKPEAVAMTAVQALLSQLIEQSADTLGIEDAVLDELRARRLINRDDLLRQLPRLSRPDADPQEQSRQRLQLLRELGDQMKVLGLNLGLGGVAPPETPP
jgi:hypothetical protein